jgi:hypothetical protein
MKRYRLLYRGIPAGALIFVGPFLKRGAFNFLSNGLENGVFRFLAAVQFGMQRCRNHASFFGFKWQYRFVEIRSYFYGKSTFPFRKPL